MKLAPANKKAGLFDLLSQDITKSLFGSLQPKEINCLRKTCIKFSELFSFHNPSKEFILCKNPHINPKDWESIFIAVVYSQEQQQGEICKFISEQNKDISRQGILKKFNRMLLGNDKHNDKEEVTSSYFATSLGIACMSRNSDRVAQEIKTIDGPALLLSLELVIANKDNKSLLAILQNIKISADIKSHGNSLIKHAYDYFNKEAVKLLLMYKCYDDLNKEIIEEAPVVMYNTDLYSPERLKIRVTLLNRMLNDPEACTVKQRQIRMNIQTLLRENGAKAAAELAKERKQKKAEGKEEEKCCIQ